MNCQDISLLLDDGDIHNLTEAQHAAAEAHLAVCVPCAAAWQAHARLCSRPVPAMRAAVPARIWQALSEPAAATSSRLSPRSILLGAMLVAGAAAAMVALEPWQTFESPAGGRSPETPEAVSVAAEDIGSAGAESLAGVAPESADPDGGEAGARGDGPAAGGPAANQANDRPNDRLIVLPVPQPAGASDPAWILEDIRRAIADSLSARPNLDVVVLSDADVGAVDPPTLSRDGMSSASREAARAIAGRFGGTHFLSLMTQAGPDYEATRSLTIHLYFEGPSVADQMLYHIESASHPWAGAARTGASLATRIYAALFPESARVDLRSRLTDAALGDEERLQALDQLSRRGPLSDTETAAALDLARTALSAETRRGIWEILSATANPALIQPLTEALLHDAAPSVRSQAAAGLAHYLDDPSARLALRAAAAGDPSADVRLRALWQTLSSTERRTLVADTLKDSALPLEERIAPLLLARHDSESGLFLDEAALSVLVGLAREGSHTDLDIAAIREVERRRDYVGFLLEKLESRDRLVRMAAQLALQAHHADVPGVREALDDALEREFAEAAAPRALAPASE